MGSWMTIWIDHCLDEWINGDRRVCGGNWKSD